MTRTPVVAALLCVVAAAARAQPVTFEDEVGDVRETLSSDGPIRGRDVVRVVVDSDGERLSVEVTLSEPPSGTLAGDVVRLFVDADADPATGQKPPFAGEGGFEKSVDVALCIDYSNGALACAGGAGRVATGYTAAATVEDLATGERATGIFEVERTPVDGAVLRTAVPYADLGVSPGRKLRLYARESDGSFEEAYMGPAELTLR